MRHLRVWLLRFGGFFGRSRRDDELVEELTAHLQAHIDDNLRAGMTPEEARRRALIALGGIDQTKEQYRDRRGIPFLETTLQDLRYALRSFRKSPAFAGAAVVTLGVAIGALTALFSFGDGLVFRPPAVSRPGELVRIFSSTTEVPSTRVSHPDYLDFRSRNQTLSDVVAYYRVALPVSRSRDDAAQVVGAFVVSGNFFTVLGVEPALGRGIRDDDDRVSGAEAVAVISHNLWQRTFQSDPAVVGRQIMVARRLFTIVGVAPAGFEGIDTFFRPDLYVPIATINDVVSSLAANIRDDRSAGWLTVVGRLRPGVTTSAASAEMTSLALSLEQAYPVTNRQRTALTLPEVEGRDRDAGSNYQAATLLLGIGGFVLLLACVNVANLLLSHAAGRTKEIAVRLAVGASRGRLVRQLLTESVLLASGGGLCGLALAYGGVRYLSAVARAISAASDLSIAIDFRLDERVLVFTLVTSFLTSVVFGLMPALRSTRVNLVPALNAPSKTDGGRRRWFNTRSVLVASQVALSFAILVIAGLSIRHFIEARDADPGFQTDHALLVSFDPSVVGYDQSRMTEFYDRIIARAKGLPGVTAVGLAQSIPLVNGLGTTPVIVDGYDMPKDQDTLTIRSNIVDSGYWGAMRTSIVRGRAFDERDTSTSPRVVVVNETMAGRYWPNRDAVGQTVRLGTIGAATAEVVGVAKDGKYQAIDERQQAALFIPFSQKNNPWMSAIMIVRAAGDATNLAAPIRSEVQALDPAMPVFSVRSLESAYQALIVLQLRLLLEIMSALGLLALVLAVVGLYGVVAYRTALRTREIGIRMALGADRRNVLLMVLKPAAGMVGVGVAAGIGLALLLIPAFASAFNFVLTPDATVLPAVALVLIAAAFAASLVPARRAAMVNPTVALRDE